MKNQYYSLTPEESTNLVDSLTIVMRRVTEKVARMVDVVPEKLTNEQVQEARESVACTTVILISEIVFKMLDLPASEYQNMIDHIAQFFRENSEKWKLNTLSSKNEKIH